MKIDKLAIKKTTLKNNFDYQELYSNTRGAIFKQEYRQLISQAITKKKIVVEKLTLAEGVGEELDNIVHTKGLEHTLLNHLKNHHNESDYITAPIIYVMKQIDPTFKCTRESNTLLFKSNIFEVDVRPRIDETNAVPRLFFPSDKIAITSTNDDIETLGDVLAVKDIKVYAVGTDDFCEDVIVYKINRTERYFEVVEGFKDELYEKYGSDIRNIKI